MKMCIAEKPSVAKEIANILGATTRRNGYLEGNGYCVTWTFGHLCTLQEPGEYTEKWQKWNLGVLPMIPSKFRIRLIEDEGIKKQFAVIEELVSKAEMVINCGDAGQEGELIQRWVLTKAKCGVPIKRLWISSLTEEAIREGFEKLMESQDFDTLYAAGSARAIGDWLLGMNATRAYTLKYGTGKNVLSIGRVQTLPWPWSSNDKKRSRTLNRKLIGKYGRITGKDFSPVCADGSIKKRKPKPSWKRSFHSNWKFSVSSGKRPWNIRRNCST